MTDHAASMDRMYRHQRYIYDASRRFYLLGRDTLIRGLDPPSGGHVLELGCGTGRNLAVALARYPTSHFYGCDISAEMLKSASAAVTGRAMLAQADATCIDPKQAFGRSRFDRIYFSYTLSMVPDWQRALSHSLDLLESEGELHVVDFGQCEGLPRFARAGLFAWLSLFGVHPHAELPEAAGRESRSRGRMMRFSPLFRGYAWHAIVR